VGHEYEFEILQKDDNTAIPIRVNHIKHHVYDIEFEPNSTSSYVLKAKAKTPPGSPGAERNKLFDEFNLNSRRESLDSNGSSSRGVVNASSSGFIPESSSSIAAAAPLRLRKSSTPRPHYRNSTGSSNFTPYTTNTTFANFGEVEEVGGTGTTLNTNTAAPHKSTFSQISSLEDILEKTKTEIYKKLNDLKAAAIKVQFEVESDRPVVFEVRKASDGEVVDFQPVQQPNNRHIIYFNYDQIVDFVIGVRSRDPNNRDEVALNAQIDGELNSFLKIRQISSRNFIASYSIFFCKNMCSFNTQNEEKYLTFLKSFQKYYKTPKLFGDNFCELYFPIFLFRAPLKLNFHSFFFFRFNLVGSDRKPFRFINIRVIYMALIFINAY
jgi:hypothetical protein